MSESKATPTFISAGGGAPIKRWVLGSQSSKEMPPLQVSALPMSEGTPDSIRLERLTYSDSGAWWLDQSNKDAPHALYFAPYETGVFTLVVTLPPAETTNLYRGYIFAPYPGGIVLAHSGTEHFYVITPEDGIILDQVLPVPLIGPSSTGNTYREYLNNVIAVCFHDDGSAQGKIALVIGEMKIIKYDPDLPGEKQSAFVVTGLAAPGEQLSYASDTIYVSRGDQFADLFRGMGAAITAETGVEGVTYRATSEVYSQPYSDSKYHDVVRLGTERGSRDWIAFHLWDDGDGSSTIAADEGVHEYTLSPFQWGGVPPSVSVLQVTPDGSSTYDPVDIPDDFQSLDVVFGFWSVAPVAMFPVFWTGFQRAIETAVERAVEPSEPDVPTGEFVATFTLTAGFMSAAGSDVYGFVDGFFGGVSTDYLEFGDVVGILYTLAWGGGVLRIELDDIASGTDIGITIDGTPYAVEWTSGNYGLEGYLEIAESPFVDGGTYTITISMSDPVAL